MSRVSCHFPMKALYNVDKLCMKINKVWNLLLLYEYIDGDRTEERVNLVSACENFDLISDSVFFMLFTCF
jgi:hypothetical protein